VSPAASKARRRFDPTVAEAIHGSTNAPGYFDRAARLGGGRYWDGAIGGYGCPILAGLMEALASGAAPEALRVLSLGGGRVLLPPHVAAGADDPLLVARPVQARRWPPALLSELGWLASSVVNQAPDATLLTTHVMLGGRLPRTGRDRVAEGPLVRLSPFVAPWHDGRTWTLTDPSSGFTLDRQLFADLRQIDIDAVLSSEVGALRMMAELWLTGRVRNQPIRYSGETLRCEIGQDSYACAKAAWLRLVEEDRGTARLTNPAA
jgi:hypothetical protein